MEPQSNVPAVRRRGFSGAGRNASLRKRPSLGSSVTLDSLMRSLVKSWAKKPVR